MPLIIWDASTASTGSITVTNGGRTAACTASAWHGMRSNIGVEASTANHYVEFSCTTLGNYCMVGICKSTDSMVSMYTGATARLHYTNGTYYNNGSGSSYGSSWGTGDVIRMLLKNGKLYFGKNSTWYNSADFVAETGFVASGLTGTYYLGICVHTADIVLNRSASELAYSVPSGASLFVTPGSISQTLVLPDGTPVASASVDWAFFEQTDLTALTSPIGSGSTTTGASGELSLSLDHTNLADGDPGLLIISNTDGSSVTQCRSFCAPVTVSVP